MPPGGTIAKPTSPRPEHTRALIGGKEPAWVIGTNSLPDQPGALCVQAMAAGLGRRSVRTGMQLHRELPGNRPLPTGLMTEHDAVVTPAGFTAADSILIVAGTSSIGPIGIQLANALGASTVAVTTSENKCEELIGADIALNHVGPA